MNEQEHAMYLDWLNNFITVERFAEHYGITTEEACRIIAKYSSAMTKKYKG